MSFTVGIDGKLIPCPHCKSIDCGGLDFKYGKLQLICTKTKRIVTSKLLWEVKENEAKSVT
jgi:hypothetical protein